MEEVVCVRILCVSAKERHNVRKIEGRRTTRTPNRPVHGHDAVVNPRDGTAGETAHAGAAALAVAPGL